MRLAALFFSLFILALALLPAGEWMLADMPAAVSSCTDSCAAADFSGEHQNEGCCGGFCNPMQVCAHCALSITRAESFSAGFAENTSVVLTPRIKHFEASYTFEITHPPQTV